MIDLWAIIVLICCVLLPRVKLLSLKRKVEKRNLNDKSNRYNRSGDHSSRLWDKFGALITLSA